MIGLAVLGLLALSCCLCWCCYCRRYGLGGVFEHTGSFEFYYIDRCTDRNCPWHHISDYSNTLAVVSPECVIYNLFNKSANNWSKTQLLPLARLTSTASHSGEDPRQPAITRSPNADSLRLSSNLSHRKLTPNVSVSKVRVAERTLSAPNPGIKPPIHQPDDDSIGSSRIQSGASGHVKVSRIKSSAMGRRRSSCDVLPSYNVLKPAMNTKLRRNSVGTVHHVRVDRVQMAQGTRKDSLLSQYPRQSIIDSTIRLDDIDKICKSARPSSKTKKHKVLVKHVPSADRQISTKEQRPSQIDTIDLSLSHLMPPKSTIHVEHVSTSRKRLKSNKNTAHLGLIIEETQNSEKSHTAHAHSSVTVKKIPRANTSLPLTHR
ncbi:unnamed protein product [Rotaria sp. Silwood2]|nr:unnamed protein product [Rotaria sp. Silwood2]CAF4587703.1 unnamed protein product [Rotaria sp. Silwood2]